MRLLLDALSDLPVTARLVKASDVGKIVKRLKKDRKESGDEGMADFVIGDQALLGSVLEWPGAQPHGDPIQSSLQLGVCDGLLLLARIFFSSSHFLL